MNPLYVIQSWRTEKWVTFYVTNFEPDASEVFDELKNVAPELEPNRMFRLVEFKVTDYDFLSTFARDVQVVDLIETAGQSVV